MKINKLFHWLYAGLMLLPLFGVLFTSLYVSFNPNAKDSYEYSTKMQVVTGNSGNVITGNTIYLKYVDSQGDFNYSMQYYYNWISIDFSDYTQSTISYVPDAFRVRSNKTIDLHNPDDNSWISYGGMWGNKLFNITFVLKQTPPNFFNGGNSVTSVIYQTQQPLSSAFTTAVNQINENPLYSWAQSSFLVAPIAYITAIFGLASTSPIVTLLSYWLTISIVWLCFDLIMYIPLLVHRWIDKGILE